MVNATLRGDAYVADYALGYTDTVELGTGDTASAADAVLARLSQPPVFAGDSAPAGDAVAGAVRYVRTCSDSAPAGDAVAGRAGPYFGRRPVEPRTFTSDAAVATFVPAGVQPSPTGGAHLRVYDKTGQFVQGGVIPEFTQVQIQDERNQDGQLTASLPLSAEGVGVLADMPTALLGVYVGGRQIAMYVYDEDDNDPADPAGPDAELAVSAPGALSLLSWAMLYPQAGFDTPAYVDFVNITPGAAVLQMLNAAKARGTLDGVNGPDVACSFDATYDSDGVPWPQTVWMRYEAAKTVHDVVMDLVDKGYFDVRMRGLTLDLFAGNGSPDLSTNVLPASFTDDAQGWLPAIGEGSQRDPFDRPPAAPEVTASFAMTSFSGPPDMNPDDPNYGIVPTTDLMAMSPVEPVVAGQPYVGSCYIGAGAAALPRMSQLFIRWYPTATPNQAIWQSPGADGGTDELLDAHNDVTRSWTPFSATTIAPDWALSASLLVKVLGVPGNETHWVARPAISGPTQSSVSADLPGVVLRKSSWVKDAPKRRSRSAISTVLLALGDSNISLEVENADAVALYGRREGAASQSGVTDAGTLQAVSRVQLERTRQAQMGYTVDYVADSGETPLPPQPWADYVPGNWIRADWLRNDDGTLERVRVSTLTAVLDPSGFSTVTVELNDLFLDQDERLARQVSGLLMSTSPTSPGGINPADSAVDLTTPSAVASVAVGSTVILQPDGSYRSIATVTWPAVETNTDGSPFDDLGSYTVQWRLGFHTGDTDGWTGAVGTQELTVNVPRLPPNEQFQARVLVTDYNGHYPTNADGSPAYTLSPFISLAEDQDAPTSPSAPVLTALPGGIGWSWDGLDSAGAAQTYDFDYVEVHVSTVSNFTPSTLGTPPSTATLADVYHGVPASANGTLVPPLLQYGLPVYVRLVAVDVAGNRSAAGVQAGPLAMRLIGPADLDPAVLTNTDHSAMLPADQGWSGGSIVVDGAARDGEAVQVSPGQTATASYSGLKPGRYRATYVIRTDRANGSPPPTVGIVDVAGTANTSDGARTVTTADVLTGQGYRTVSVRFTVTAATNTTTLSLANTVAGGNVWLSHAYVEPVMSIAVAEIRDAMVADLSATKLTAGFLTADVVALADANGKPGRLRVGVVNPATGLSDQPGFEVGVNGLRGQQAGGMTTFFVDPATGAVSMAGTLQVGSTLPQSVYGYNLIANAAMEDLPIGASAGVAGVLPATWVDGFRVAGTTSSAYADQAGKIGGSQSLTVQTNDNGSGRSVASRAFPVVPGERLQVQAQLQQSGAPAPVFVDINWGTDPNFTAGSVIAGTGAVPQNCQALAGDGSLLSGSIGPSVSPGISRVAGSYTPPGGTLVKVSGSVVVPAGATWARLELAGWARPSGSGSTFTRFDNCYVVRSQDGHTLMSATIQTGAGGNYIVMSAGAADTIQFFYGGALAGTIISHGTAPGTGVMVQSSDGQSYLQIFNGLAGLFGTSSCSIGGTGSVSIAATGTNGVIQLQGGSGTVIYLEAATQVQVAPLSIFVDNASHRGLAIVGAASQNVAAIEYLNNASQRLFAVGSGGNVISTSTTITTPSDQRLKRNIRALEQPDALGRLARLRPVTFEFKWAEGRLEHGLVAQELREVFPEHVKADDDGTLQMRFPFDLHAIAAFREVAERLAALEARLPAG